MQLMVATFNNYQELVDKATILEGKQHQIESRKRKYSQGKYNFGAQQKPCYAPYSGGHNHHTHEGHNHGGHNHVGNGNNRKHDNNPKSGNGGNGNQHHPASTQKDLSHITCFKFQKTGHYATDCLEAK